MQRNLTEEEISRYERDGVIQVKQAVEPAWVERMNKVVDAQLDTPSTWANDANPGANKDRMFTDRYQWRDNPEIKAFVFESGVGRLAGQAMRSRRARFYFDHILVKEPETSAPTPWHQDVPYWPFLGKQICSVWLALNDVSIAHSAMEFIRGSHADGKYYLPELFGARKNHPNAWIQSGEGEPVPPIEDQRDDFDIVGWNMDAGDVVLFSAWILHGAPGNSSSNRRRAAISTRWLGDDAIWHPHQGADPTVTEHDVCVTPGQYPADDDVFPLVWGQN